VREIVKQNKQPLLSIVMGAFLLMAASMLLLSSHSLRAAGSISRVELIRYSLSSCIENTFQGSYGLVAYDTAGTVVNNQTSVSISGVFSFGTEVFETASYPHNSSGNYTFTMYVSSPDVISGTAYFYVTDDPSIRTSTYVLDCAGPSMYLPGSEGADDRLNWAHGDLLNVLYSRWDEQDNPEIWVYSLNESSQGVLAGHFGYNDFNPYLGKAPQQNTFIGKIAQSSLYALTTGEFQINVGPDAEGKVYSVILDTVPPTQIYYRDLEPDEK
jgi:hypothetical protein